MILIYHGENQVLSRKIFNEFLDSQKNTEILRLENKEITSDLINQFLNSQTLFSQPKTLALSNFFSLNKTIFEKNIKIIKNFPNHQIVFWQDKKLNLSQLKQFPQAQIQIFPLDNLLYKCLYAIRPGNHKQLFPLLTLVFSQQPLDLFLYLLKKQLRQQLTSFSKLDSLKLKTAYLQIIELDFQNKTGKLTINREIAIERILLNLIS